MRRRARCDSLDLFKHQNTTYIELSMKPPDRKVKFVVCRINKLKKCVHILTFDSYRIQLIQNSKVFSRYRISLLFAHNLKVLPNEQTLETLFKS